MSLLNVDKSVDEVQPDRCNRGLASVACSCSIEEAPQEQGHRRLLERPCAPHAIVRDDRLPPARGLP
jgi:hypothetical protein